MKVRGNRQLFELLVIEKERSRFGSEKSICSLSRVIILSFCAKRLMHIFSAGGKRTTRERTRERTREWTRERTRERKENGQENGQENDSHARHNSSFFKIDSLGYSTFNLASRQCCIRLVPQVLYYLVVDLLRTFNT